MPWQPILISDFDSFEDDLLVFRWRLSLKAQDIFLQCRWSCGFRHHQFPLLFQQHLFDKAILNMWNKFLGQFWFSWEIQYIVMPSSKKCAQSSSTVCPERKAALLKWVYTSNTCCDAFFSSHMKSKAMIWLKTISSGGIDTRKLSGGLKYFWYVPQALLISSITF